MDPTTIVTFIGLPILGVVGYMWLVARMRFSKVADPPIEGYFVIFVGYGGTLVLVLNMVALGYSAMTGLGFVVLGTAGTAAMAIVAYWNFVRRELSGYHRGAMILSALFVVLVGLFCLLLFGGRNAMPTGYFK